MTNADRHGTRPRGQALVEFALISPLSFLLFMSFLLIRYLAYRGC